MAADEKLSIICGAKNVADGMKVPVAKIGAVLPDNFKIKKAKLRGVESFGMICSESEMGMADSSDGILELPADAPIGTDIREWLNLDDNVIDVDLTPDRGDCLSLVGVAREVGVVNRMPVNFPEIPVVTADIEDAITVAVDNIESCPRYCSRVIKGIDPNVSTPLWMQEKLRRGGIRSLSFLVDVTNFVLLELGQPMHAFDRAKLTGTLQVKDALGGEKFELLNGDDVEVKAGTLLIADDSGALALAGIMGGMSTSVTDVTTDIVLEAAHFVPLAITGKARSYGLHTDSSHRFERGVDTAAPVFAIQRATALIIEYAGGQAGPLQDISTDTVDMPSKAVVLRRERIEKVLGIQMEDDDVVDILQRLEMSVERTDDGWNVVPPSHRFDIEIEVDLIEELGRIYGYSRIPNRRSSVPGTMQPVPEGVFSLLKSKLSLVSRDYQEAVTYTFISPEIYHVFNDESQAIRLSNPISEDLSVMRSSLWPGLVIAAKHNLARQQERVRMFESGLKFVKQGDDIHQEQMLAGLVTGDIAPKHWDSHTRPVDFYDIKGDVEAILATAGILQDCQFIADEHPVLHPGQTARIEHKGKTIGWVGLLHPELEKTLDLEKPVYLFELNIESIQGGGIAKFKKLSRFPSIRRDFSLVMDDSVSWSTVEAKVRDTVGDILKDIFLFDVYTGKGVDSGRKSLALRLILQDYSETLTDERVEAVTDEVLTKLSTDLNITLRD